MSERTTRTLCGNMTTYGECLLTEEPCVQGPCSMEQPEEWAQIVRCGQCAHRREPKCNQEDYTRRGVAKCGNRASPCSGRLVYLTDFCSHGAEKAE